MLDTDRYFSKDDDGSGISPVVRVVRADAIRGIFVGTSLDDEEGIREAFRRVARLAAVHDIEGKAPRFVGVLYPHQRVYQAVATVAPEQELPQKLDVKEIAGGKFGSLSVAGGIDNNFAAMKIFTNTWLPESGYRIADISGFETFSTDPTLSNYSETTREIFIRIEPAV